MASLNLSANGPSISKSYQAVLDAPPSGNSPTYSKWAVFSVSTPLVNVFEQNAGNSESVLKVQSSGESELEDLIEEFSEGKVQFGFVKVIDPNTGLPKYVLIAWCGEGVPERTKGYFTSHLAAVSKFLHGYHVQITARADGDLTPEGIVQKVADSSGSKYSAGSQAPPPPAASKPSLGSKPVFTPSRNTPVQGTARSLPPRQQSNVDDDGWGDDAPPVTRTQLEKVAPAYKPTKVNIHDLKSQQQSSAYERPAPETGVRDDVVKGGYQPVGKVDIAAIRRAAQESGELKDDRPTPVKGSYEPVGKVDLASIRSRAQGPDSRRTDEPPASSQTSGAPGSSERLTSLPKPKVANKFGGGPAFGGTKPPVPGEFAPKPAASSQIGSASRTFADQGGKTPAQIWAEKKAKQTGGSLPSGPTNEPVQSQHSGQGEWKSSYTGKSWAPVQTTHTGKSAASNVSQPVEQEEATTPQQDISAIREQLSRGPPPAPAFPERPETTTAPSTIGGSLPVRSVEPEPQPRSPTPPPSPPVRESSPIQVAMPVGRGAEPPAIPVESRPVPVQEDSHVEETSHVTGHAAQEPESESIRAIVQYDYEKAEDNELELREGEYVTDIEMVDNDWWLGVNPRGERGLFPSNYVEIVEGDEQANSPDVHAQAHEKAPAVSAEPPAPAAAPIPEPTNAAVATAVYDYEAAEDNELSFPEGAQITNIEFPDEDWWFGEYKGHKGLFPANYVELSQ